MTGTGMQWCETAELADMLRVGEENHEIINSLALAVPEYIEETTGYPAAITAGDAPSEIVKQLARFLVQWWFSPDGSDAPQVRRVVNSLTIAVKAVVREGIDDATDD